MIPISSHNQHKKVFMSSRCSVKIFAYYVLHIIQTFITCNLLPMNDYDASISSNVFVNYFICFIVYCMKLDYTVRDFPCLIVNCLNVLAVVVDNFAVIPVSWKSLLLLKGNLNISLRRCCRTISILYFQGSFLPNNIFGDVRCF